MDFAKIYDLIDGSLLLITKETDDSAGDEKAQLIFRVGFPDSGYTASVTIGYKSFEIRDGVYESFTQEEAQKLYDATPRKNTKK